MENYFKLLYHFLPVIQNDITKILKIRHDNIMPNLHLLWLKYNC